MANRKLHHFEIYQIRDFSHRKSPSVKEISNCTGRHQQEVVSLQEPKIGVLPYSFNSRKSARWSAVPVPCLSRLCLKLRGEQGSGPEGVDDLCFHSHGEFSPSPPPPPAIRSLGWDLDFEAEIWASRLGSGPRGQDLGL